MKYKNICVSILFMILDLVIIMFNMFLYILCSCICFPNFVFLYLCFHKFENIFSKRKKELNFNHDAETNGAQEGHKRGGGVGDSQKVS